MVMEGGTCVEAKTLVPKMLIPSPYNLYCGPPSNATVLSHCTYTLVV